MKGLIFVNPFLVPKESVHQAERLKEEFNKLGIDVDIISDASMRIAIQAESATTDLPRPDFIVYLDKDKYLSKVFEKGGTRLFNSHNAVRICDDKAETYIALAGRGIKFPKTMFGALCYRDDLNIKEEWADKIINHLNLPVIVKESYGSMGKGIYKAETKEELLTIMEKVKLKPHLFQEYIPYKVGVDVRVIVIGGKAVASMQRINDGDFRSNVGQGGRCEKIDLPLEFCITAQACAEVLGLDYCGVDLLYGKNGEPIVCEVNSNAFFGGIEEASGVNVARLYAKYIINCINAGKSE